MESIPARFSNCTATRSLPIRENIYLSGLRRNDIARKLDSIIDFSGIREFIDTPVRRYSSGMYVRLFEGDSARGTYTGPLTGVVRPLVDWTTEYSESEDPIREVLHPTFT